MIFSIWLLSFILTPSIADVPLNLADFNSFSESHLIATLNNRNTDYVTYMEEYTSSKDKRKGKIEVFRDSRRYSIFYDERDDFRVVMTDTNCQVFNYKYDKWDPNLPDVNSELENILIMFGPSIYFRIQSSLIGSSTLSWKKGEPEVIRGIQVNSKFASIESMLNVTVYEKADSDEDPIRIDFKGTFLGKDESFTIDHYLTEFLNDLSYDVVPTPGIGCPEYPTKNMPFPSNDLIGFTDTFHLSAVEYTYQSSESSGSDVNQIDLELFVDASAKIVRYIVDYGEALLETIYDYNTGISFAFEEPRCSIAPMTADDIGVVDGKFDVQELLWQRGSFKYLGKILFEQRNGVIAHVWEKIEYDTSYEGTKYAKIVTTQYFADKIDISFPIPNNDHKILLGMTRKLYSLDVEKNYQLEETSRRDVYDFYETISEPEYQTLFQVSDCDNRENDKLWLIFELRPVENAKRYKEALKTAEQNLIMLRKGIRDIIVESIPLSPLRINNIDFDFSQNSISAHVLFTEKPKLTDALIRQNKQISRKSIKPYSDESKTLLDCVSKVAIYGKESSVAWCKDLLNKNEQLCAPITDVSTLKESRAEDVISCEIYSHPVGSLRDLVTETDLSTLHDSLLARALNKSFKVGPIDNQAGLFEFIISNVIYSDVTEDLKSSKLLFDQLFSSNKLKSDNSLVYTPDQSIKTLGDCYYICETSEAIDCTSFSFCINPKDQSKVSCQLTSQVLLVGDEKVRDAIEADDDCTVYSKNHIFDFVKIKGRQLKQSGVKELTLSAEQCAAKCAASVGCKSFDYCDKVCALSDDIYLDKLSSPNAKCDSYMLKKTENFKITGNSIVDEIMFVETGVNLDQCASLCFDYVSGDDKCHSFNYCPKGRAESTCQLSQKTISKMDKSSTSKTAINCFNYQLVESTPNDVRAEAATVTSAGGGVLAIVLVVCLTVGLIYGFVGEYIYLKVNNKLRQNNTEIARSQTFTWSRQVDESTFNN